MKKEYTVQAEQDGLTVREYVRSFLGLSSRALKSAKYNGMITVNERPVHTDCRLHVHDTLLLDFPDAPSESVTPQDIPLDVLYEDEDVLIVNKPSAMASHPTLTHKDGTLANAVMYYYRDIPFTFRLLTRLDADTTGVAVIAKNALFADAFSHGEPIKTYHALCVGVPLRREGLIDAPIGRAADSIIKRTVTDDGKAAQTKYRVLSEANGLSLVEACPLTGRTHQIRLHLSHIGCPLYGDFLYGTEISGERTRLHCKAISFIHPTLGERLTVEASLPADFFPSECQIKE